MTIPDKYKHAVLPVDKQTALKLAEERELWAAEALERLQYGSAREFELTALLLRFYADQLP